MAKLTCWNMAIILLCWWCWTLYGSDSMPQYSSIRIYTSKEDVGEITLFILLVVVSEIGKRLDKGYICPVYCEVDHKHYFREIHENKYEQESNLQAVDGLHNPVGDAGKEQPASSL